MARALVSVGSNLDRETSIRAGLTLVQQQFGRLEISPVYESAAVGIDGPAFLNLVVGFLTEMPIPTLAAELRIIESRCGRIRAPSGYGPTGDANETGAWTSRTLDLDLLTYDDEAYCADGLQLPRDEIERYPFVLKPLLDLEPDGIYRRTGDRYATLWAGLSTSHASISPFPLDLGVYARGE